MYYLCSENKGADQLGSYWAADLHLYIDMQKAGFLMMRHKRDFSGFLTQLLIMITGLCIVYPLTPHFYIIKLGFTGVYIFFLFLL